MIQYVTQSADAVRYFGRGLSEEDPEVFRTLTSEAGRQQDQLELIAAKNYMSRSARDAMGSIIAFTSGQGNPGKRDRGGMGNLEAIESLAIERARELFGCSNANVQAHSGTQANAAVFFGTLNPGDTFMAASIRDGGHLSHGLRGNMSGKWFNVCRYSMDPETEYIDYDTMAETARRDKPKLIIVGGSAYPRVIDLPRVREIADEIGALVLLDACHFAGLIASGHYPSPFPYADIVTTTMNKNLRGPRGALILSNNDRLGEVLDAAVHPGTQGGPLPEQIAAKAVALEEARTPAYARYGETVLANAREVAKTLQERGVRVTTGGTDTPLVIIDLRKNHIDAPAAAERLESVGMPMNTTMLPGQEGKLATGLRLGTSAITTRGADTETAGRIANLIADVILTPDLTGTTLESLQTEVRNIAHALPIYPN